MSSSVSRRDFIAGLGTVAAVSALPVKALSKALSPFKLSIFSDELTPDFERALEIVAEEFNLGHVEVRSMWGKNIMRLDEKELAEAQKLLDRYKLRVSSIAGPLFKVDWPGAPIPTNNPQRDQFKADFTFEQQDEVLERGLELARRFKTDRLRCFDFWRLDDQRPYRAAINAKLLEAANKAGKKGVTLVMENEYACNTATAAEAAQVLAAVRSPYFKLNWDPGNSAFAHETPYPTGYGLIPKGGIGHVHCKDVARKPDGTFEWMAMGRGFVDFVGQFRALKKDGYRGAVVLETHWRGAGTPEESSRQSMAGLKEQLKRAGTL